MRLCVLLLLSLVCVTSCSRTKCAQRSSPNECYKVYKIQSINNVYLISVKKEGRHYLIVSNKSDDIPSSGIAIRKGYSYPFKLESKTPAPIRNGVPDFRTLKPTFVLNDTTSVHLEGTKFDDLYYAKNIKDIYLIED